VVCQSASIHGGAVNLRPVTGSLTLASDVGDTAAVWSAIGQCGGTLVVAITAVFAILAFRKQSAQLRDQQQANERQAAVLALQAKELQAAAVERERQAVERRREQASKVTIRLDTAVHTTEPPTTRYTASINNASSSPVYNLSLNWYQGTAPWKYNGTAVNELAHLMPGADESRERTYDGESLVSLGAVLEFTDAAGVRWRRQLGGELTELASEV